MKKPQFQVACRAEAGGPWGGPCSLLRQQGGAFLCRGRGLCLHRGGVKKKVNNLHKMEVKNKTLQQLKYPAGRSELPARGI